MGTVASEITLLTTVGWPNRPLRALAFEAFKQRRFLAANVRARADPRLEIKSLSASRDIFSKVTLIVCDGDRALELPECVGIFGAEIDVTARRADGESGNRHAFNQNERIALHDHAIGIRAAVAFISVANDIFLVGRRVQNRFPLDARRETGAAAPSETRVGYFFDDRLGSESKRAFETAIAAVADVIGKRQGIGDAAAREGEAFLLFQVGDVFGDAEVKAMRLAFEESRVEQARHFLCSDWAIRDPAARRFHFNERLEPEHAARAIADHRRIQTPRSNLLGHRFGNGLGSNGERRRVARHKDFQAHACLLASSIRKSATSDETRP